MAAEPLNAVSAKLTETCVSYSIDFIKRQFKYIFCYDKNIQNLRDELESLKNIKHDVKRRKMAAENNLRQIGSDVEQWIKDAEDVIAQADEVLQGTDAVDQGCLYGNCWSRYSLSRKAVKKTNDVIESKTKGEKHTKFSYDLDPVKMASASSAQAFEQFKSRELKMQEVMEALKDDQIKVIGICGMAGVGKTTMVKKLKAKFLSEKKLCDYFIIVDVTKENPDPKRIQLELASGLGLDLKGELNKHNRADRLRLRLSRDDRIIVVLDDVWEPFDLSELGVPLESKECKVILTSRNTDVCNRTGAQKVFEVGLLSEKEAWDLFVETVRKINKNAELHSTAKDVAKQCQQLPLAIVVVGGALAHKGLPIWKNSLEELRRSVLKTVDVKDLYSRLRLSYKLLENDEAQSLLLLCSLFPEDFDVPIESLVRYSVGLQLFKDVHSLAKTRDRIDTLVDLLRCHHLLLPEIYRDSVKLHDVVRGFCISITAESGQLFLQGHRKLDELAQEDLHEDYTSVSLKADFLHLIPTDKICSTLKVLQVLQGKGDGRPVISVELFTGMQVLEVLELEGVASSEAEEDFPPLINLKTLCLHECFFHSKINIGSLCNLEILSFYASRFHELSSEIGQLSNLKLLDLRFIKGEDPCELPPDMFLGLKKLEELYLGDCFQAGWDKQGTESFHKSSAELSSLSHLTTFQLFTSDVNRLKVFDGLHLEQLSRFEIIVSTRPKYWGDQITMKKLKLNNFHVSELSIKLIQALLTRTEKLSIKPAEDADFCLNGMKCFTELKESNGFIDLKSLSLEACEDMEYLIDTVSNRVPDNAFKNLKSLKLERMESFKEICHGNLPSGSFSRLQELSLYRLPGMTHLWRGFVQLPSLNSLKIGHLPRLKSLSTNLGIHCLDTSHESDLQPLFSKQVILPRLERLEIRHLEKIVQVVDDRMETGSLDGLKDMSVRSCKNLLNIASSDSIKRLHKLERLRIESCPSLKSVFDFEHIKFSSGNQEVILNEMKSIHLGFLPELIHIWRMVPTEIQAFQNLRLIQIFKCDSLRCLFSPPVANMLVNLQLLGLYQCKMMEAVIKIEENSSRINVVEDSGSKEEDADEALGTDNKENAFPRLRRIISPCCMPTGTVDEKDISDDAAKSHEKIVLPGLRHLELEFLENLEMFCSSELAVELPSLDEVIILQCTKLKTFCAGPLSTPKLRKVRFPNGLWKSDDNSALKHIGESHTLPEKTEDKLECGSSQVSTHSEIEPAE